MFQTDEDRRQVELVINGYTISTRTAAIARIGADYVMRDCHGRRISLASDDTDPARLYAAWVAFQRIAAPHVPAKRRKDVVLPDQIRWKRSEEGLNGTLTTRADTTVSLAVDRRPDGRWEWLAWRRGDTGNVRTGSEGDAFWAMERAERAGYALLSKVSVQGAPSLPDVGATMA